MVAGKHRYLALCGIPRFAVRTFVTVTLVTNMVGWKCSVLLGYVAI